MRSQIHQSHQKLADQLVRTCLAAQMFGFWRVQVERVPAANPHLSGLLVGKKPVIGLALLRPADIARYGLLDHCTLHPVGSRTPGRPAPTFDSARGAPGDRDFNH